MRLAAIMIIVAGFVAACGAEAPPRAPAASGVSISGEARIGVSGRL